MSLKLSYATTDGSYRAINLTKEQGSLVLGRDRKMAQLVVPDSQVSRAHCVIALTDDEVTVEDLGSRNGTYLNQTRINKAAVKAGDRIVIGATEIRAEKNVTNKSTDALLGLDLGGFKLQEVLGRGSFGTVYRGLQVALRRPVAIKVLDERHKSNPELVKSFLSEARRAGALNHPNLVQIHDVRQEGNEYILVMELMTGGSVSDFLRTDGPLDSDALHAIMVDIGRALSYAESQRIVHRDVKPDNILVNDEGVYKLADLGIAEHMSNDGQAHQVKAFGSAYYVAPEQARGGSIDARADIYALGASIWHLAAGAPIFEGTSRQIVTAHINEPLPDLRQLAPHLQPDLVDLLYEMLAKNPEDRPTSGADVATRVMDIVEGRTKKPARGATRRSGSGLRAGGRRRHRRRRRR